jgi:hypothetical protein
MKLAGSFIREANWRSSDATLIEGDRDIVQTAWLNVVEVERRSNT